MYFAGSSDLITLKGNYIHHTSGRSPKVSGNTLVHAVNNYFYANSGHAFEGDSGAMVVAEGNVFQNVVAAQESTFAGKMYASASSTTNTQCSTYLGHACQLNAYGTSGALSGTDTSIFSYFNGKNVASADTATNAKNVVNTAGYGKL